MSQAHEEEIAQLLRRGLDHYGGDEVDAALRCWQRVLELDPANADATDYIEAAGREPARGAEAAASSLNERDRNLIDEALRLAAGGGLEDAYRLIEGAAGSGALDLETATVVELLRARLRAAYARVFDAAARPRLAKGPDAIARHALPEGASFLVSLCDGRNDVADLVASSGMDAFEALHNLKGLLDAGIVSVET